MEPFDPRDNGFAEELRSFFVYGGNRSLFIPFGNFAGRLINERKIASALVSVPHTVNVIGPAGSFHFWIILQLCAAAFAFFMVRNKRRFLMQLPVIVSFSLFGLHGIIMTGVLAGFRELLHEPLNELFSKRPFGNMKERFKSFRSVNLWIINFFIMYIVLSFILDIPAAAVWTGFAGLLVIEVLSYARTEKWERASFTPVHILPFRPKITVFNQSMAVFAITALLGSLFMVIPGVSSMLDNRYRQDLVNFPSASAYREHMEFQASFSYRPLGVSHGEYMTYMLGNDGLIAGTGNAVFVANPEIPVFPLDELTQFLLNYNSQGSEIPGLFIKEWFSLAFILVLFIPVRRIKKTGSKENIIYMFRNQRMAA